MEFNFKEIEARWKNSWERQQIYKVENGGTKPKYYILDMFPYPSGAGLHVGHPLGYIASDIFARYKRMKGFNVLHPMGFDTFGLPTEQYAIETGQHPLVTTKQNIAVFRSQLENIALSFDWSREVITSEPSYYKWTQYLFIQIYNAWFNKKSNKAEPIKELIKLFEQFGSHGVEAFSTEHESFTAEEWHAFTTKEKEQVLSKYRLAYQAYAEVNWCPELGTVLANDEVKDGVSERGGYPVEKKKMRQWFLRITAYSDRLLKGLETLDWSKSMKEMQSNWIGRSEGAEIVFSLEDNAEKITVFTTRPDTIFGVTFLVLAPENELVELITTKDRKEAVNQYQLYVNSRTDVERQQNKAVTGEFTGGYAIHPFTGQKIPVYIAEYVLSGYGTGAIMAVPADDERDAAFAEKFHLPIINIIDRSMYPNTAKEDKIGKLISSEFLNGKEIKEAIDIMLSEIEKRNIGSRKINYRIRDAGFSRQRYWGEPIPIKYVNELPEVVYELPLILPEVESYKPGDDGRSPLSSVDHWVEQAYETDTMPGYAGSSWYFLRYMDPHNENEFVSKEAEEYWQNVDFYLGGSEHAVGHLLYARLWQNIFYDLGLVSKPEPFQKLVNQGMIQGRSSLVYRVNGTNTFVSKGLIHQYETTALHCDIHFVENDILDVDAFKGWREEYLTAEFMLEDGKYYCGAEIEKMSKRWYNVVNPDDMVAKYGADCFRMYEMFLGPIEDSKPWNTQGIDGVAKFLRKFWRLFFDDKGNWLITDEKATNDELKILHKTIKKIDEDIERLSLNTSISAFMICCNELTSLHCHKRVVLEPLLSLMAPFAPFITEELWSKLGHPVSIHLSTFPVYDPDYLIEHAFDYPISFNGKVKFNLSFPLSLEPAEIEAAIRINEKVISYLDNKEIKKVIVVKAKIVNIVI